MYSAMTTTPKDPGTQNRFETDFFVLRTPLLPFDEVAGWGEGLKGSRLFREDADPDTLQAAWKDDVQLLRGRLRSILDRPEVLHALFVASPSLQSGIDHWRLNPDSKKGIQAERALTRYFERMSTRPTPFGLFSGTTVGRVDSQDDRFRLALQRLQNYRTCTRLDFDYLFALTSELRRDPALSMEMTYRPNSSLYRASEAWHYVESRVAGSRRSYNLVKVPADEFLNAVLDRAQNGASFVELCDVVLQRSGDSDVSGEDARGYIQELVHNDVIVSSLVPLLTGQQALDDLIDQLASLPSGRALSTTLQGIRSDLANLDHEEPGVSPSRYKEIASAMEALPGGFDLDKGFQVDMITTAEDALLGKGVIDEILHGVDVLCRLGDAFEPDEVRSFRDAFSARYEGAMVPLLEALDEDIGIGFGRYARDCSPLLRGIGFGAAAGSGGFPLSGWHTLILKKLIECARDGKQELSLDAGDLPVREGYLSRLPDSFSVSAVLVARSAQDVEAGAFDVHLMGGSGPSGARMFGRFCHADGELERLVRSHLAQEANHNPEAVFAEVVYLPEGRLGNVLCRPVLREYEIPYLARSGAPKDHQIPLQDLLVGVSGGRITLYSKRLEREVMPRLSNAHGFVNSSLPPAYRFLCCLQHQSGIAVPNFFWGSLGGFDFLPRLRVGRLVLSLATWQLSQAEIHEIGEAEGSGRFFVVQEFRKRRNLPRWVVLQESDHALTVDLDNPLSVDAFVHVLKRSARATIVEMYPPPELLCVTGPEGRFHHELNVPFVRRPQPEQPAKEKSKRKETPIASSTIQRGIRTIGPGQDWLYVKLYGGSATLDDILTGVLAPLVRQACAPDNCHRWFFTRYADHHSHLRIRFHGQPDWLQRELMPRVSATFNPLLASGRLWKVQFDTYDREIERYGGREAMSIAEDIFFADSEAALEILAGLEGDDTFDTRWRVALLGLDRLLSDCGLDLEARKAHMERLCAAWNLEFRVTAGTKKQLAGKLRGERKKLQGLLGRASEDSPELSFAWPIFESRARRIVSAVRDLHALEEAGLLITDISDLIASYMHMHVNRLIRSSARAHELVLYDFLFNLYDGMLARERSRGKRRKIEPEPPVENEIAGNAGILAPALAGGDGEL